MNSSMETHGSSQILVVDDSPSSLKLLTDILTKQGYEVRPALGGSMAVRSLAVEVPDLILLDVNMPDLDGYEVCRRLKSEERSRDIPVIFISARDEVCDKINGFNVGGVDYITKPIEPAEVLARVATHLRLHELNEQLDQKVREATGELTLVNQQLRQEIAERKRTEDQLSKSLAEKEVLLREIHHRVKNNLQIVSSLVGMQADTITDENTLRLLKNVQERIGAMALVHELLYRAGDFSSIDFSWYIETFTKQLYFSYITDPDQVSLSVEADDVSLALDQAMPFALIINELLSNALKYAFPSNEKGKISIRLRVEEQENITLTLADNGVGMQSIPDFQNPGTLGLELVHLLIKQLRGSIEKKDDPGTTFILKFRRNG